MKMNTKYILLLISILSSWLFISGCSNTLQVPDEEFIVSKGAVAREEQGNHTNYNLTEGKYNKLETEKVIVSYDTISGNYIYEKDGKVFTQYKNKSTEIVDSNIINLKLSPGGEFYSYFNKDEYMQLVVKSIKDNKEIKINSTVAISGKLMDWSSDKDIVYYGIDESTNGIFSYDINSSKEELIYELDYGYLEFIKSFSGEVLFLQDSGANRKVLKSINKDTKVNIISENVSELKDIVVTEKGIFLLGKIKEENNSIYELRDGIFTRLVYDFPNIVHLEKGLSCDENGELLFIGSIDSFDKENIYKYENGYIKSITNDNSKYYFVNVK